MAKDTCRGSGLGIRPDRLGVHQVGEPGQDAGIGAGTLVGAAIPLLGAAVFVSFIIFFWLPISGEIGAARPARVPAGEEAPPRPAIPERQPSGENPAPVE